MTILPPTSFLPPIKQIQGVPVDTLSKHVAFLENIFTPYVRGSGLAKTPEEDAKDQLRADDFERSYSVRWLTAIISSSEFWQEENINEKYDSVLQQASRLLALFSGPSTTSSLTRRFVFPVGSIPDDLSSDTPSRALEVVLQDISIDSQDFSSVGNQTWGGSCVLAETVAKNPTDFLSSAFHRQSIKVLELGAGTGLVSIVVAKLLRLCPSVPASVIATDFHPSVLSNLEMNVRMNFSAEPHPILCVQPLDWSSPDRTGDGGINHFDLILGADIIYEADHARWIKGCVERYLIKPADEDLVNQPAFHLIIPLRRTHQMESVSVEKVFGTVGWVKDAPESPGWTLGILSVQDISRAAHSNDRENVTYKYFRIGWGVI